MRLEERLRVWRREFLNAAILEGSARWSTGLVSMFLFCAAMDAAFTLPLSVRWALFCLWIAASLAGCAYLLLAPMFNQDARRFLRDASIEHPVLSPYILTAWELMSKTPQSTSTALARAHIEQTERILAEQPYLSLYPARISRKARRGLLGLFACSGVLVPWLHHSSPGITRVLAPWRDSPLSAWVEVSPGNLRALAGTPVTITAKVRQKTFEDGLELWLRDERESWMHADWDGDNPGSYSYRILGLNRSLQYRVHWRDQRTPVYTLEPVPYPQMTGIRVSVHLPGRADAMSEVSLEGSGEISALRGSWIVIRARAATPLSRASIRVSYLNASVEMREKAPVVYEAGFPLSEDGDFHFELLSAQGAADPHPVSYTLKAQQDKIPTVQLLSPSFDVEASPRDSLPITYEAHDDEGLASVSLVYRAQRGKEEAVPISQWKNSLPSDHIGDYAWDLSALPLGERVEFQIRVVDRCASGPQSGYSEKRTVRLVDFEGAHAKMELQWLAIEDRLEGLAEQEARARRTLQSLADSPPSAQAQRLNQEWDRLNSELSRAWPQSAGAFQELADAMAKDPYANPGMARETRAQAAELADASNRELPRALQSAKAGDWKDAQARHARLEAAARKASRLLKKGKEIQGLQDFWSQAQRLDQAGAELSSSLTAMAKGSKKVSSEDRRKLEEALRNLREQMDALAKDIDAIPKPSASAAARNQAYGVPLNQARRTADALAQALRGGDYAEAARVARQLSEQLSQVRQAIADAARASSSGSITGKSENPASGRMEEALALWRETLEEQSRSLDLAQKLEEDRARSLLQAQRKLLEDLAARQKGLLDKASALGGAVPAETADAMRMLLSEFSSYEAARSQQLLPSVVRKLQLKSLEDPVRGHDLAELSKEEQNILDGLVRGADPPAPTDSQLADGMAAAAVQGQTRRKTSALEGELRSIQEEAAAFPLKVIEPVVSAQEEQSQAENHLHRLDVSSAIRREQRALELLEQGMQEMSQALEEQKNAESGALSPFSAPRSKLRPAGAGAAAGADAGFVPLPSAEDYQPTQEIRRDLEKSLQERRPSSYDRVIKDYFKRISQ